MRRSFKRLPVRGVDVSSEEDTSDYVLQSKVEAFELLSMGQRERIAEQIRDIHTEQFGRFFNELRSSLSRRIEQVFVLPLSGSPRRFDSIEDAVRYISTYNQSAPSEEFVRYELNVRYSNRDEIRGVFQEKDRAIEFLHSLSG